MGGKNDFFGNFERNKYLKKLPSMQSVKKKNQPVFWAGQWAGNWSACLSL